MLGIWFRILQSLGGKCWNSKAGFVSWQYGNLFNEKRNEVWILYL